MVRGAAPEPFTISVAEEVLVDLRQRLDRTRWPDEISGTGWQYGTNLSYLKQLVHYWRDDFDWRKQERLLNCFEQYRMQLDDIKLHFIHQPGVGPNPMPLLISHGWPGSVWEFHRIIGPLTDPARYGGDPLDAFTVVAPSLPGYGFSHVSNQRRLDLEDVAELFHRSHRSVRQLRVQGPGAERTRTISIAPKGTSHVQRSRHRLCLSHADRILPGDSFIPVGYGSWGRGGARGHWPGGVNPADVDGVSWGTC